MAGERREDGKDMDKRKEQEITRNPRMLFTGPDYIRDHRVTVEPEHRVVGIGTMSREGTSEVDYLWRAAPGTPFPRPKTSRVGEIGWGIEAFTDWSVPVTGRQVMMGEFRQELENRHAHKYQNPWYPGPDDEVMNVYKSRTPPTSGTALGYWRRRGRTPAATPLYTTNILRLITSSGQEPELEATDSSVNINQQEGQQVAAY